MHTHTHTHFGKLCEKFTMNVYLIVKTELCGHIVFIIY